MAEVDVSSIKPNSFKARNGELPEREKEKISPVVKKDAVKKKKVVNKTVRKVVEFFADEEIDGDLKTYIFEEWVEPGVKDILWDVCAMLLGDSGRHRSKRGRKRYDSYYKSSLDRDRRSSRRDRERKRSRNRRSERDNRYEIDSDDVDYRDIRLEDRRDAEKIVDALRDRIKRYGEVTVAELFELCNISGEYTDNDWGWDDADDIGIRKVRGGDYLIDVAEAKYLKD